MLNKKLVRIIPFILIFTFSVSLFAQGTFKVGEVSVKSGEKKSGYIIVPAGSDGDEVQIPITVINGAKSGPVLALVAAVHGYEYPPVLALQRLIKLLDPAEISGKVILVHVANIPSFLKRTVYYTPKDWKNMNRVFPGKIDGTISERIAYQITKEVVDKCDALIDNHCGDGNEDLMPYLYCTAETGDSELDKKIKGLATSFGLKVIVRETGRTKEVNQSLYLSNTAILRGKPAISTEAGKLGRSDEDDIIRVVTGCFNILKHLKMIKGEPELLFEPVWVQEYQIIRSEHDGLFYPLVSRGDHVQKGELAGYLTDFFGNIIQKVHAPHTGIVLYIIGTPPMSTGEPMVSVGKF
ncbi:succinylglutamate desuccinylase/aspartoacylase family protein [candidate division KSB1 bacterium]